MTLSDKTLSDEDLKELGIKSIGVISEKSMQPLFYIQFLDEEKERVSFHSEENFNEYIRELYALIRKIKIDDILE